MKHHIIVTLLAVRVALFPTLLVAADDQNTLPPRQSANAMKSAKQAGTDDKSHMKLGRALLGLGTAVFVFGLAHPVPNCPYRPCDASTRDARVFVSGFVVATTRVCFGKRHPCRRTFPRLSKGIASRDSPMRRD